MIALQQQPARPPPGSTPGDTDTATPVIFGLLAVGLVMTLLLCGMLAWALTRKPKPAPHRPEAKPAPADDAKVIRLEDNKNGHKP